MKFSFIFMILQVIFEMVYCVPLENKHLYDQLSLSSSTKSSCKQKIVADTTLCEIISLDPTIVIKEREFQVTLPSGENIKLTRKNFEDILAFSIENSSGEAIFSITKGSLVGSISGWKNGRWLIEPCLGLDKVENSIEYCHTIRFKNKIKDKKNDVRGFDDNKRKLEYIKEYKGDYLCANGKLSINRQYCCSNLCKNECISDRSIPCVGPCCGYEIAGKKSCFNSQAPCDMMTIQTLSIAYTVETLLNVNGKLETLQSIFKLAVDELNTAYLNSRIPIKMILVDTYQVDFTEEEGYYGYYFGVDEGELFFDFVNDESILKHKADFHILIYSSSFQLCGVADIVDCLQTNCNAALVAFDCLLGQYTLAHEIGHLQGASHDVATEHGTSFRFPNAYGYLFYPFCTIMAYCNDETVVNYFSNPDVAVRGFATGTSNADNSFALLATRYEHSNMNYSFPLSTSYMPTSSPTSSKSKTPTMRSKKPTSRPTRRYDGSIQGEFCFDGRDPLLFPYRFYRGLDYCVPLNSSSGYFAYKSIAFKMAKDSRVFIDFKQNTCSALIYLTIHSNFNSSSLCSSPFFWSSITTRDVYEYVKLPSKAEIIVNSLLPSNSNFTEDSTLRCCFSLAIGTTPIPTISPTSSPTRSPQLFTTSILLPSLLDVNKVAQVLYTCTVGSPNCKTINNCGGSKYVVSYRYTVPIDGFFEFKADNGSLTTCKSPIIFIAQLNICTMTSSIVQNLKAGTNLTIFIGSESNICESGSSVSLSIHNYLPSPTKSPVKNTKTPSFSPTRSSSPTSLSPSTLRPTRSPKPLKIVSPTQRQAVPIKKLPSSAIVKPTLQRFWTCDVDQDLECHYAFNCIKFYKYVVHTVIYEYSAPKAGFYRFYTERGNCKDTVIVLDSGECNDDIGSDDYHSQVISYLQQEQTIRIIVGGFEEQGSCQVGAKIYLGVSLTTEPTNAPTLPPSTIIPVDLPMSDFVEYSSPTKESFCYAWREDEPVPDEDHYTDYYGNEFPYCPIAIRYPATSGVFSIFKYTAPYESVFIFSLSVEKDCRFSELFLDVGRICTIENPASISIALRKRQVVHAYASYRGISCSESFKLGVYEISKQLTLPPTSSPTFRCQSDGAIGKAECKTRQKKCHKKLKWTGDSCTNSTIPDAGCQCKGYCGYTCQKACQRDSECYWDESGACYVKKTRLIGGPQLEC